MWRKLSLTFKLSILVIVVLAFAVIQGCSNLSPVAPEQDETTYQDPFGTSTIEAQWGRVINYSGHPTVKVIEDPEEPTELKPDTLDVDVLGYKAEYIIPPQSSTTTDDITCTPYNYYTAKGMVYIYNFGPDGKEFDVPTTLKLEIAALEDYNPKAKPFIGAELRLYNPQTRQWELQEIDNSIEDGFVEFSIDHYSRYGIGGRNR
ncbi:MAG: hypothetical protein GY855_07215 [candidate division Zixibacteria bacterium]|nr:hypothetical protein [candidate division Zixibacteria bacterium]